MSILAAMKSVLAEVMAISPGTLVTTGGTYDVYRAFSTGDARAMLEAGYDPEQVDLVVLISLVQLGTATPPRPNEAVTLDGVTYVTKSPVTSNAAYLMVPLRKSK